ncbi:MAG: Bax inhibitor-1/YccA family protein [Treponema sp.]|nr:Bax inhibitor-1/YccA family protein [Spirochaetia bacterium]MDD7459910.1 Bax inhibitor-1/YccA family protein [Spirochaetales bacterium]MDY5810431.1 Bax inhibitor-1/YccA family protein [Treponema sp.]MEE1182656.1 Bax inhibitor-1/YccA family protein [Treponema sp.]
MTFDTQTSYRASADERQKFVTRTYMWMGLALIISALAAYYTATSQQMLNMLFANRAMGFKILAIGEIALVFILSMTLRNISVFGAGLMFIAYSVVNGITLSSIFLVFNISSIAFCFGGTALMFIAMSIYGKATKQDLSKAGYYLMMAVIGLVVVSLINWLLKSSTLDWLISIATVVVFTGLTAYDTQKILYTAQRANGSDAYKKIAIVAALELYLDFINIFLSLLRLFGKKNN